MDERPSGNGGRRRLLLRMQCGIASVVLGVVTTVVVAAAFAWSAPPSAGGGSRAARVGNDVISFNVFGNSGSQQISWVAYAGDPPEFAVKKLAEAPDDAMPYWTSCWVPGAIRGVQAAQVAGSSRSYGQSDWGAGWPLIAFHGYETASSNPVSRVRVGILDLGTRQVLSGSSGMVRMRQSWGYLPVWPGLGGDAALFAAGWWGVFVGLGLLRARVRRGAGKCAACGYALAGLPASAVCPECGRNGR